MIILPLNGQLGQISYISVFNSLFQEKYMLFHNGDNVVTIPHRINLH